MSHPRFDMHRHNAIDFCDIITPQALQKKIPPKIEGTIAGIALNSSSASFLLSIAWKFISTTVGVTNFSSHWGQSGHW